MDYYKKLGVNRKTAKPGDLMTASQRPMMKKAKKHKKVEKEPKGKKADVKEDLKEVISAAKENGAKKIKIKFKKAKLGTGERFSKLKGELASKGAKNPAALAAYIGRKKFGAKKFGQLSAKGRKSKKKASKGFVSA